MIARLLLKAVLIAVLLVGCKEQPVETADSAAAVASTANHAPAQSDCAQADMAENAIQSQHELQQANTELQTQLHVAIAEKAELTATLQAQAGQIKQLQAQLEIHGCNSAAAQVLEQLESQLASAHKQLNHLQEQNNQLHERLSGGQHKAQAAQLADITAVESRASAKLEETAQQQQALLQKQQQQEALMQQQQEQGQRAMDATIEAALKERFGD